MPAPWAHGDLGARCGTPDGRWDIYLATSADGGKSWSRRKVNDDAHCASHLTPHTALDPKTGILHITWLDNRSGVGALAYASCAPGGSSCSANEAVSDTPLASYTYERHLPGWLAEYGDAPYRLRATVAPCGVDAAGPGEQQAHLADISCPGKASLVSPQG